ncbi:TRAP-type C4-dicarboxylate transport system, small permease component [Halobacteroides halobius DSM 5150]|uniref:TRAP-type C4-dicarboxylate transport system, small permease component n=1 Tax=Halobacteroides halobius (strain ATCC 35273 / DSM 5150 / MD-1) TaxID=748449 RepID=L0KDF9_HALHC|nr:TRAP transporter small permease [Halobacteroides halobius]AGB42404.1 TRAP-type C4-dicarboxylate transport system, small permease component [Halobacteroides halobius DSM 5150]
MFKKIYNLYKYFVIFITITIMIVVNLNVFSRYVLNNSLGWASEASRFLFIWLTFLGAVLAYEKDEHIGLDLVIDLIPSEKVKTIVRLIADLGVLLVIAVLIKTGITVVQFTSNTSPALQIPMSRVYAIVPVSTIFMFLIALGKIKRRISNLFSNSNKKESQEEEKVV